MDSSSFWHWILVFGHLSVAVRRRQEDSELMGDFAQGIKSFKGGGDPDGFA
jgi:hypothetical protein